MKRPMKRSDESARSAVSARGKTQALTIAGAGPEAEPFTG